MLKTARNPLYRNLGEQVEDGRGEKLLNHRFVLINESACYFLILRKFKLRCALETVARNSFEHLDDRMVALLDHLADYELLNERAVRVLAL